MPEQQHCCGRVWHVPSQQLLLLGGLPTARSSCCPSCTEWLVQSAASCLPCLQIGTPGTYTLLAVDPVGSLALRQPVCLLRQRLAGQLPELLQVLHTAFCACTSLPHPPSLLHCPAPLRACACLPAHACPACLLAFAGAGLSLPRIAQVPILAAMDGHQHPPA